MTFTNTTPDSSGGFSSFGTVPLSLQAGASVVGARDGTGSLRVTLARQASRTVATVVLRSALRYRQSVVFTLTYRLADAANPQVRMRTSSLMIPLWGYGTASSVTVHLASAYSARVFGASMTTASQQSEIILSSGPIRDPVVVRQRQHEHEDERREGDPERGQQHRRAPALPDAQHREQQQRPDQVELLLDRQRPEVLHRRRGVLAGQVVHRVVRQAPVDDVQGGRAALSSRVLPVCPRLSFPEIGRKPTTHVYHCRSTPLAGFSNI